MPAREQPASASQWLMTAGIITFALVSGVVMFGVIVIAVIRSGRILAAEPWSPSGPLTLVGLGLAAVMVVLAIVIPPMIARHAIAARPLGDTGNDEAVGFEGWGPGSTELLPALMTSHIVRLALLEGAAFFNLIAYMLEGKALSLIAAIVLVLLMATSFLTESRVRDWLERAREVSTIRP